MREHPASIGQRLLWYLDHYRGAEGALNCPLICRLRGPLDEAALRRALDALTVRHESLRTTFARRGRQIMQQVHEPRPTPFARVEVAAAEANGELAAELRRPIDPAAWPVRATLFAGETRLLCLNMHHLVSDGVSGHLLMRDLRLLAEGRQPPPVGWQYAQFSEWQSSQEQDGAFAAQRAWWQERLAGLELAALPLGPDAVPRRAASETVALTAETTARLRQKAREQRTTLFTLVLACYYQLLARLTGQCDLAVASLYANRTRAEVQNTVGFFANTVLLRTRVGGDFPAMVRNVHATVMDAFVRQSVPYHTLTLARPSGAGHRADDVVFQMIAEPMERTTLAGAEAEIVIPDAIGSRFELELSLVLREGRLTGVLFYNAARLAPDWARELVAGFAALAAEVACQ